MREKAEKVNQEENQEGIVKEHVPYLIELTEERKRGLGTLCNTIKAVYDKVNNLSRFDEEESDVFEDNKEALSSESFSNQYEKDNEELFHQVDKMKIIVEKMDKLI